MTKKIDIWFPFYIGDYLTDTMHLSAEEHGAYLLLIIHYWKTGNAIKNDKKTLKNIAKINSKKMTNILHFFTLKNGYLYHKRIDEELAKAASNKADKSKAGKKGMEKRYNKKLTDAIIEPITNPQQNANPSPSPSHYIIIKDNNIEMLRQKYLTLNMEDEYEKFIDYGKAKGKKYKDYDAAFRTWCRTALKFQQNEQQQGSGEYATKSNNGKNYGASKSEQARAAVARGLAAFGVE